MGPPARPKNGQLPKAIYHAIALNEIHLALKRSQRLVHWMPETEIRSRNELTDYGYRKDCDALVTVRTDRGEQVCSGVRAHSESSPTVRADLC